MYKVVKDTKKPAPVPPEKFPKADGAALTIIQVRKAQSDPAGTYLTEKQQETVAKMRSFCRSTDPRKAQALMDWMLTHYSWGILDMIDKPKIKQQIRGAWKTVARVRHTQEKHIQ